MKKKTGKKIFHFLPIPPQIGITKDIQVENPKHLINLRAVIVATNGNNALCRENYS